MKSESDVSAQYKESEKYFNFHSLNGLIRKRNYNRLLMLDCMKSSLVSNTYEI